jgi:hypothetical protein
MDCGSSRPRSTWIPRIGADPIHAVGACAARPPVRCFLDMHCSSATGLTRSSLWRRCCRRSACYAPHPDHKDTSIAAHNLDALDVALRIHAPALQLECMQIRRMEWEPRMEAKNGNQDVLCGSILDGGNRVYFCPAFSCGLPPRGLMPQFSGEIHSATDWWMLHTTAHHRPSCELQPSTHRKSEPKTYVRAELTVQNAYPFHRESRARVGRVIVSRENGTGCGGRCGITQCPLPPLLTFLLRPAHP